MDPSGHRSRGSYANNSFAGPRSYVAVRTSRLVAYTTANRRSAGASTAQALVLGLQVIDASLKSSAVGAPDRSRQVCSEERDVYQVKNPYFDYAEVLLQSAIVVSVSLLASSPPVFAVLGAFLTPNGYTLLVKVPFLGS